MRRRTAVLVSALLALLLLAAQALASGTPARDFTESPSAGTQDEYYVVTLADEPAATYEGGIAGYLRTRPEPGGRLDPGRPEVANYVGLLRGKQADYATWLANKAPAARVADAFALTANALVVRRNGVRPSTLAQGPGVRSVVASSLYRPTMNVSTDLVGAGGVWAGLGGRASAGEGIKIGIIDTGIDFSHPFFACKGDPPPAKVYFSGEGTANPDATIVFDHGTHVAGTAAGCAITLTDGPVTGDISGMAPGATLYDYNVFPGYGAGFIAFGGSAFSHDIIRAVEDAVADGMDVINMSLGGTVEGPHDVLAEAVDAAAAAGVVAAVAAGNSGPGDSTVESPGSAPGALTAGASTNPHFIGIPVDYDTGSDTGTIGAALGDFDTFDPPVTAAYTVTDPANGCSAISTDLGGKIALIDRGACSFTTKIRNAENAGAVGVLVVNNVAGDPVAMGHDGTAFPGIPAAMLGGTEGASLKPSGSATVDGTTSEEILTANADIIAGFSSRGPTPYTGLIKPDLTAPGVNVHSSVFDGAFALFQGTSMASPHLAGAAALLLDAHPDWSPADVKSAMVTTAVRPVTDHVTGTQPTGVLTRGGGRLDVAAASQVPATFDPASVSFGVFEGNAVVTAERRLAVSGDASCTVAVEVPGVVTADAVSVSGGDTLTLTLDAGRSNETGSGDYEGDVVLTCDGTELRVPWFVRVDRKAKP